VKGIFFGLSLCANYFVSLFKMSLKTLPILFLNLGGEMMYILDQRLRAQSIPDEKAKKVMHDIVGTMLNRRFMDELFKPQDAYSKKAMRTVFDRLAHASIMRLNSASMDKLYDLMTMAFKYQVSLCQRPHMVLLVTLNHMDAVRNFVKDNNAILEQVENVYALLTEHYSKMTCGEFQLVRQTLLSFFQDMHIRVSIFLKDKVQTPTGRFKLPSGGQVPWDTEVPGVIRLFNNDGGERSTKSFNPNARYQLADQPGTFELFGDRATTLGTNMYNVARSVDTSIMNSPTRSIVESAPASSMSNYSHEGSGVSEESSGQYVTAELDLLQYLVCGNKSQGKNTFRLNFFNTDEEEEVAEKEYAEARHREILVDARQRSQRKEISDLMDEFSIQTTAKVNKGDDLLELMDSA